MNCIARRWRACFHPAKFRSDSRHSTRQPRLNILGLSAFYQDSAACLVRTGALLAAAQEERFTRKKHDAAFRRHAVEYCLREGGLSLEQVV